MCEHPTKMELRAIRKWKTPLDFHMFMAYIETIWRYADCGYWTREGDMGNIYKISTGGWSGNEEIIQAMRKNVMFWMLHWYRSQRGGHYIFVQYPFKFEEIMKGVSNDTLL